MNNKKLQPPLVGVSSLLVVFAVLCLTIFALLGLGTAQAGKRLSDVSADNVKCYYEADLQAERILAQIRSGHMPEEVTEENGIYSYTIPVTETQELRVEVCFEAESWKILRWQTTSTAEWSTEEQISVWNGKN